MDWEAETNPPFMLVEGHSNVGQEQLYSQATREKRKIEFVGWCSRPLMEFLKSIGKDTTNPISQFDISTIVNNYVEVQNLLLPNKNKKTKKRKRVVCDEKLYSLFGKKSINKIMIYELLEPHIHEPLFSDDSDDDLFLGGKEGNKLKQRKLYYPNRMDMPTTIDPRSCFAAIIPENIKLVYLRRSLVQDILKQEDGTCTAEAKIVRSFVRTKSDPNDYLQKHPHYLLQVIGLKKVSGTDDSSEEIMLEVSGAVKDLPIGMLSDEAFSEEECEDLRQRIKDGLLKRPTVEELQQKAELLHEDITKKWLERELLLLKNLIDRASEKGWRRELVEYLERRELLQKPEEQARLMQELPKVVAELVEPEASLQNCPDEINQTKSQISILEEPLEAPTWETMEDKFALTWLAGEASSSEAQQDVPKQEEATAVIEYQQDFPKQKEATIVIESQQDVPKQKEATIVLESQQDVPKQKDATIFVECQQDIPKQKEATIVVECQQDIPKQKEATIVVVIVDSQQDVSKQEEAAIVVVDSQQDVSKQEEAAIVVVDSQQDVSKQEEAAIVVVDSQQDVSNQEEAAIVVDAPQDVPEPEDAEPQQEVPNQEAADFINIEGQGENEIEQDDVVNVKKDLIGNVEVIELSDDDDDDKEESGTNNLHALVDREKPIWHYLDPNGNIQGPFSITSLKHWSQFNYFPPDFKIWKTGQSLKEAVYLNLIINMAFPKY